MYTINNQIARQPTKALMVENVFGNNAFEILSITLEKGTVFPEHTSPREAVLILLQGSILFHIEGEEYLLDKLQLFRFPANTPHWVESLRDSKFLIIR